MACCTVPVMTNRTDFTTRSFVRSHGRQPRGFGRWLFQESRSDLASDADLVGEVFAATGTFTEAKRQASARFGAVLVAVLP